MNEHPQVRAVDHDGIERKISGFAYDFLDLCGDMFMIQAGCILSLAGGIGSCSWACSKRDAIF